MSSNYEKLYGDIFAVLSRWEFVILRVEVLLLWDRILPSLLFNLAVHAIFWSVALTRQSTLFVLSCVLGIFLTCDVFWNWIKLFLHDPHSSEGSFTHFVECALKSKRILSVEELSHWTTKVLYHVMSVVNGLAPCRRSRPFLFFVFTTSASLACIVLSRYVSGLAISYGILNICLIAPVLIYHNVVQRMWNTVKPVLQHIEAELDKNQLETVSEREAGEAELYGPIVAAAAAADSQLDDSALLSDRFLHAHRETSGSEDLDTSEAVFIQQFVPKMSNEEIDRLFDSALDGKPNAGSPLSLLGSDPDIEKYGLGITPCSNQWVMSDEYATDDDDGVEELVDEVVDDGNDESVSMSSQDRDCEGFVVVPKSQ